MIPKTQEEQEMESFMNSQSSLKQKPQTPIKSRQMPHYWPADRVPVLNVTYCNCIQYVFAFFFIAILILIFVGIGDSDSKSNSKLKTTIKPRHQEEVKDSLHKTVDSDIDLQIEKGIDTEKEFLMPDSNIMRKRQQEIDGMFNQEYIGFQAPEDDN